MAVKVARMTFADVRLGADPELFLQHPGGAFVSAIDKIGGSKVAPKPIDNDGSAVQEDGVAVEFNIAPAGSAEDFIRSISKPMSYLAAKAREMGLQLAAVPSAIFPDSELLDIRARTFGCDPDWNAWSGKMNPHPQLPRKLQNMRTAGGHIHVSWVNPQPVERIQLCRAMDIFVGCGSTAYDHDDRRRALYGKAGAHRVKDYGLEYRVCSNWWVDNEESIRFVYGQTMKAIDFLRGGNLVGAATRPLITRAINKMDTGAVRELDAQYHIFN